MEIPSLLAKYDMNCQLDCIKIRTTAIRTSSTIIRPDGSLDLFDDGEHVGEPCFVSGRASMTKKCRV